MAVYVVTWNLNEERLGYNQARREFIAQIESFDHTKDSGLETVRWISTTRTPNQISAFLRQKLDDNDRLFISQLRAGETAGRLKSGIWGWIKERL